MNYAKLDEDNFVIEVIVADPGYVKTLPGKWVKTCPNSPGYAGRGMRYNGETRQFEAGIWEQFEKIELIKDNNGKQIYDLVCFGEHKTESKRVPAKQLVSYLRNLQTGRIAPSRKPTKRLPPEL